MIILSPFLVVIYLVQMGVNILLFFLIIRVIWLWRPIPWLYGLNKIGENIVDDYLNFVSRYWMRWSTHILSIKGRLVVGILILELVGIFLTVLIQMIGTC